MDSSVYTDDEIYKCEQKDFLGRLIATNKETIVTLRANIEKKQLFNRIAMALTLANVILLAALLILKIIGGAL